MPEYGQLAAPGTLDPLATHRGLQELTFTASGYGLSLSSPVGATSFRERLVAEATLTNLRSALTDGFNLQTNGNGRGRGGTCSGDSGGPGFYGHFESNLIVAVTSFAPTPGAGASTSPTEPTSRPCSTGFGKPWARTSSPKS